jgi:hypothetical protein
VQNAAVAPNSTNVVGLRRKAGDFGMMQYIHFVLHQQAEWATEQYG